jgi:hypothetical protein
MGTEFQNASGCISRMGQKVFCVDVPLCFAEDASPEITGKIFGLYMHVWIQGVRNQVAAKEAEGEIVIKSC